MKRQISGFIGRIVLLSAILLASYSHTAFAQKAAVPNGFDQRAYAAQYMLPDGSVPVICDWTGNGEPHRPSAIPCEFCHIATALVKFENLGLSAKIEFENATIVWHENNAPRVSHTLICPNAPLRGPPN